MKRLWQHRVAITIGGGRDTRQLRITCWKNKDDKESDIHQLMSIQLTDLMQVWTHLYELPVNENLLFQVETHSEVQEL